MLINTIPIQAVLTENRRGGMGTQHKNLGDCSAVLDPDCSGRQLTLPMCQLQNLPLSPGEMEASPGLASGHLTANAEISSCVLIPASM